MAHVIELVRGFRNARTKPERIQFAERIIWEIQPELRRFLCYQGDQEMVEDVSQEALVAIAKDLPRFQGTTDGQFWKWCYHVARNKLIDRIRREKARPVTSLETESTWRVVEATSPEDPLSPGDRLDLEDVMQLLKSVKPPCYHYLWTHYILERDIAEVARLFQLSYDAARMQIKRCLTLARSLAG
jgi:RNA polymerase sigma factor (sigma-70 family)